MACIPHFLELLLSFWLYIFAIGDSIKKSFKKLLENTRQKPNRVIKTIENFGLDRYLNLKEKIFM